MICFFILFFFFFSSRRRHTRFDCDWRSDVCSSDLGLRPDGIHLAQQLLREEPELFPDRPVAGERRATRDRKSTRLNSSHSQISYAVFCLKKKRLGRRSPGLRLVLVLCGVSERSAED